MSGRRLIGPEGGEEDRIGGPPACTTFGRHQLLPHTGTHFIIYVQEEKRSQNIIYSRLMDNMVIIQQYEP